MKNISNLMTFQDKNSKKERILEERKTRKAISGE